MPKITYIKGKTSSHTKMMCLTCKTQSHPDKELKCCKCRNNTLVTTGWAYKVPKKNDKKEWKYLEELRNLFPNSYLNANIPYLGFYKDHNTIPYSYYDAAKYEKGSIVFTHEGRLIHWTRKYKHPKICNIIHTEKEKREYAKINNKAIIKANNRKLMEEAHGK